MLISLSQLILKYKLDIRGILHIGAHEAEEAGLYSNLGIGKVLWIEGNPALRDILNEKLSPYENQKAIIALVSDVDDQVVTFHLANDSQASSILLAKDVNIFHGAIKFDNSINLRSVRLDTLLDWDQKLSRDINLLNIDIQGSELSAMKGLGRYIEKIDYIYTEINLVEIYRDNAKLVDLDRFLARKGFLRKELKLTGLGWGDAFYLKVGSINRFVYFRNLVQSNILQAMAQLIKLKIILKKLIEPN